MKLKSEKPAMELFKGVMLAHMILGLHVVLICLIGLVVIFFGGIARYWVWIFLGGLALTGGGAFFIYRRMKAQGRNIVRDLQGVSIACRGSTLEVSFLGGLASVKFARPGSSGAYELPPAPVPPCSKTRRPSACVSSPALAQLYEKNLITREEFERAKGTLLSSAQRARIRTRATKELKSASGTCSHGECGTNWTNDFTPGANACRPEGRAPAGDT